MKLADIAHARTGDKGNISDMSVICFDIKDYPLLAEKLTAEKVKEFFNQKVKGDVVRYELPQLGALKFVMYDALGGGVTRTLDIDPHGKALSQFILYMDI